MPIIARETKIQNKKRKENDMKKRIISVLALVMCAITVFFCGCKSKKTDNDSTAPSESSAEVDNTAESTDEAPTEGSSEAATQEVEKKSAVTPAGQKASSEAANKVVNKNNSTGTTPKDPPKVTKDEWVTVGNTEKTFVCGKDIGPGEYYVLNTSEGFEAYVSATLTYEGETIDGEWPIEAGGYFVTLKNGYSLHIKNGKFILASRIEKLKDKNGAYPEGMYRVGTDIEPGEYLIGSTDGEPGFIIFSSSDYFNENTTFYPSITDYPVYVTLKMGDRVLFADGITLNKAKVAAADDHGKYAPGMYKVGKDIKAGKYIVDTSSEDAVYAIYKDSRYDESSIVKLREHAVDAEIVTLIDGQYVEFDNCKLVPYVEKESTTSPTEKPTVKPSEEEKPSEQDDKKDPETPDAPVDSAP